MTTYPLERPFLVIATQNPVEYEGTYPLPEAQLDRFAVRMDDRLSAAATEEARLLAEQTTEPPLDQLVPVAGAVGDRRGDRGTFGGRYVEESIGRYVVALLQHTRDEPQPRPRGEPASRHRAASPREGARAASERRDYVLPDDMQAPSSSPCLRID